jgi:hypothetical protein
MKLRRLYQEVWQSPYYRFHPFRIGRQLYAKWRLSQVRSHAPADWLAQLGINPESALEGLSRWRPILENTVRRVAKASGEHGGVGIADGVMLYGLTRAIEPDYVVETGVAAGVSTAYISAALIDNGRGRLFSVELPPRVVENVRQTDGARFDWPNIGVGWAIPPEIRQEIGTRHTLIIEDVRSALPTLVRELPFIDLFVHDDLHLPDHMLWEYDLVWPKIRTGGILASDDVNEAWLTFCRARRCHPSALCNIDRFAAVRKLVVP